MGDETRGGDATGTAGRWTWTWIAVRDLAISSGI